jgi:hypothetical protein
MKWYQRKATWVAFVSAAVAVGAGYGLSLSVEEQAQLVDSIVLIVNAAMSVF